MEMEKVILEKKLGDFLTPTQKILFEQINLKFKLNFDTPNTTLGEYSNFAKSNLFLSVINDKNFIRLNVVILHIFMEVLVSHSIEINNLLPKRVLAKYLIKYYKLSRK